MSADLKAEWEMSLDNPDRTPLEQFSALGVEFDSLLACGYWGGARVCCEGQNWSPDESGEPMIIQPVYADEIPSVECCVDDPLLVDLIAWRIEQPERWWYRRGELGLVLGAIEIERARHFGHSLHLYRTPLNWLRARGRGACVLDWQYARSKLLGLPAITLISEDDAHGEEIDQHLHEADPAQPLIRVPVEAAA